MKKKAYDEAVTDVAHPDKKTILVAEDEDSLRFAMTYVLRSNGYRVLEAANGELAYDIAVKESPDIILSDVCMPKLDGLQLLKKIRSLSNTKPLFFLVTGFTQIAPFQGYDMGVDGFFPKPFDRISLLSALKDRLRPLGERLLAPPDMVFVPTLTATEVQLGRGGCFVPGPFALLPENSEIDFSVTAKEPPDLKLEGRGVVRWVRPESDEGHPIGWGIEFEKLSSLSLEKFLSFTENNPQKALIPQGF